MKRYSMVTRKRYIEEDYCEMVEDFDGYWVKYQDIEGALTIVEALSRHGGVGSAYYGQVMENLIGEAKLFQYNRDATEGKGGDGE